MAMLNKHPKEIKKKKNNNVNINENEIDGSEVRRRECERERERMKIYISYLEREFFFFLPKKLNKYNDQTCCYDGCNMRDENKQKTCKSNNSKYLTI
jgi:hypothetical protein